MFAKVGGDGNGFRFSGFRMAICRLFFDIAPRGERRWAGLAKSPLILTWTHALPRVRPDGLRRCRIPFAASQAAKVSPEGAKGTAMGSAWPALDLVYKLRFYC